MQAMEYADLESGPLLTRHSGIGMIQGHIREEKADDVIERWASGVQTLVRHDIIAGVKLLWRSTLRRQAERIQKEMQPLQRSLHRTRWAAVLGWVVAGGVSLAFLLDVVVGKNGDSHVELCPTLTGAAMLPANGTTGL